MPTRLTPPRARLHVRARTTRETEEDSPPQTMPSLVSNHTPVRHSVLAPLTNEDRNENSKQIQPFPISMGADVPG
jgi:hypothetical protein